VGAAGADEVVERRPGESLRASAVSRSFAGVQALTEVTLDVHRNEVVGLIGPNGAGKSTLVNVLSGFDRPDAGSVELEGRTITRWSPHRRGRAGLARTFQHSHAFRSLSVRENVEVAAIGVGAAPREARVRADELLELLGLDRFADVDAAALAHGDERRLGVARALATRPRFVLLDEPAAGLPDEETEHLAGVIRSIPEHMGALVILVDHDMSLVQNTCSITAVLDFGKLIAAGPTAEVLRNEHVIKAYLGTEEEL
jgi:branched-chain amino acid transport system ATP-binding protein